MSTPEHDIFKTIIADIEHDFGDPATAAILSSAQEYQDEINVLPEEERHEAIPEYLEQLHDALGALGIGGEFILVSGKVRINNNALSEDEDEEPYIDDAAIEAMQVYYPHLAKLCRDGKVMKDDEGFYFNLEKERFICGYADAGSRDVDLGGTYDTQARLMLNLVGSNDEDYSDSSIFAYFDEIVQFVPVEPSFEKMQYELRTKYPDVYEQIMNFPKQAKTADAIRYLKQHVLEIDWSSYPNADEDHKAVIRDYIERCLIEQLELDKSFHSIRTDGIVYGLNRNANYVESSDKRRTINGLPTGVRLVPIEQEEGSTVEEFTYNLIVTHPVNSHNGGYELVFIPMHTIRSIRNHRASESLFENDGAFIPGNLVSLGDQVPSSDQLSSDYSYVPNFDDTEHETREDYDESDPGEAAEQLLFETERRLKSMMEYATYMASLTYSSDAELKPHLDKIQQLEAEFSNAYNQNLRPIEATGPGVIYLGKSINHDEEDTEEGRLVELSMSFQGSQSDELTVMSGYASSAEFGRVTREDGTFSVSVFLRLQRLSEPENDIRYGDEFAVIEFIPRETFSVELNSENASISIPDADRTRSILNAIRGIAELAEDEILPWQIDELRKEVLTPRSSEYEPLEYWSTFLEVAGMIEGNEKLQRKVQSVFRDMLVDKQLKVDGEILDIDGDPTGMKRVHGFVTDVVLSRENYGRVEPIIEITNRTTNLAYYVPFSSISGAAL